MLGYPNVEKLKHGMRRSRLGKALSEPLNHLGPGNRLKLSRADFVETPPGFGDPLRVVFRVGRVERPHKLIDDI